MDGGDGGINMRNWGFYEPSAALKGHLGLELMPTVSEKPLLGGRDHPAVMATANIGAYHHRVCGVSESPMSMDFMRDAWMHHRENYLNVLPGSHHPNFAVLPETSRAHPVQMIHQPESSNEKRVAQMEVTVPKKESEGPLNKRSGSRAKKSPKTKKPKKSPRMPRDECSPSVHCARTPRKSTEVVINGIDMDISGIPIPVCSCTGTHKQCYRWGSGGWQSACCTTGMSMYPLPMSTKRRGARIAGRKMSLGAFKKVLEKLASEGYNFSNPIDLRTHWAKHGTNKFVTIR
ncbi:protein BASIC PENTACYSTEINE2-like [Cornus florida]|uniref:protein BASIC PENTACYSTEINE2-like n=1 Tax=Cornus florida TaxID=4283 RepID=UPI00289A90CE|nr:protein BASIC PENTACYSTEINE2-like [Cornus florida]XP_059647166.1 protein BASIC PENTACYSTEINE2-like [Cornus florida]XP_059647167.1 protein BASIC PENTACYSTEINE2-like [Cornus florida]